MKATCTYENLRKALRAVEGMIGKDLSIPIIQNILISVEANSISFCATNLEIGIVQTVPAKTDGEWKIVIAPHLLSGFLNAIRGGEHITLERVDTTLHVKNDSYESEISGFDAEDFPIIPTQESDTAHAVNLLELKSCVSTVLPFVTHNEIRPELTGVYLSVEDGYVYTAATDSFRLGESRQRLQELLGAEKEAFSYNVILPQKICAYINKLSDDYDAVQWSVKDNHLSITCDGLYITTRLIDGNYPDYRQIIPQKTETNVIVKKEDLLESMRVMLVFSDKEANEVSFDFSEEALAIKTRKQVRGTSETSLAASVEGPAQSLIVNPRYVFEGVQNIKEEEVFIGVNSSSAPVVFRGSDTEGINDAFTYVVMPIKDNG